ncbi:diacylglycerol kinase [Nocardioides mangrovicus]|uniref:Diacylglycerol kinase n=1 Tax=Nocardioides mangrovicus TaxID=2478913 RepID=A0A3L8NXZ9_9ACTN|nr:diacylglycerol kinase family protein [Nocardioides mangrovicus]RLV47804.1 diacylglycerol kinase [Nocardioides mangrovicus]
MDPLLVIANAAAGTAEEESLDAALRVLRAATDVEVAHTANPGELDGVLHRAGSRRIVVAGGDGSLHAVVSALRRRHDLEHSVLGLVPLGTGNDFARGVGIPLEPADAARVVLEGEVRSLDLVIDEVGEVVVNNVHAGASAQASRRAARWKGRLGRVGVGKVNLGKLGYPIGAALAAVKPPFIRLRVEIDDDLAADLDRPVLMVSVGNGPDVGGGTPITPDAVPGDGLVDVMVSFATGPVERIGYVVAMRLGRHPARDDVLYRRASRVHISGEEFYCSADGEVYGPERQRTWTVEPGAWRMVLPR